MSIYLLYSGKATKIQEVPSNIKIRMVQLKPFSKRGKGRIANFYWWLICRKTFLCEIFDVETEELMHYTYAMKRSYKFPFMTKNDYMMGPSVTLEKFRGRGFLSKGLAYLQNEILALEEDANFIALIREENISSRKGVEKSGMVNTGKKFAKNKMKIYKEVIE